MSIFLCNSSEYCRIQRLKLHRKMARYSNVMQLKFRDFLVNKDLLVCSNAINSMGGLWHVYGPMATRFSMGLGLVKVGGH